MIVDSGELLCGMLCKKTLGAKTGSLMHIVFNELGYEITAAFYANIQVRIHVQTLIIS